MNNISLIELIISVIITFLSYCIIPIILRLINGKMEYKKGHRIILINCVIVWLIYRIISIEVGLDERLSIAVVLYYFINKSILLKPKIEEDDNENDNKEIIIKESSNSSSKNINSYEVYGKDVALKRVDEDTYSDNKTANSEPKTEQLITQKEDIKNITANNGKIKILYTIIGILSFILIILSIYTFDTLTSHKNKIKKMKAQTKELEVQISNQELAISILENKAKDLEKYEQKYDKFKEKLDFYDDNIVFVIDGYGKYYYTYDQMEKVTQGIDEFSYWAYNKEQAKDLGYKKWK